MKQSMLDLPEESFKKFLKVSEISRGILGITGTILASNVRIGRR